MALYLATVGNDPAPVAMGLRIIGERGVSRVVLLEEEPTGLVYPKQREALHEWLKGSVGPGSVERHALDLNPEAVQKTIQRVLEGCGGSRVYVNLTGGSKLSAFFLYKATGPLPESQLFAIEAHRLEPPKVRFWKPAPALPQGGLLDLPDYLRLYAFPAGAEEVQGSPGKRWKDFSHTYLRYRGAEWVYGVWEGRPWVANPAGISSKEEFSRLRDVARELGGQHALTVALEKYEEQQAQNAMQVRESRKVWAEEFCDVYLLHGQTLAQALQSRKRPAATTCSFALPQEGPVFVALPSDQLLPLVASFVMAQPQPKQAYLITTPDKVAQAGRLEVFLKRRGVRVQASSAAAPEEPDSVRSALAPVLEEAQRRGLEVRVNLNGGTKLMVLGLVEALAGGERVEYLDRRTLWDLEETSSREVGWEAVRLEEALALHGFRLIQDEQLGQVCPDPKVLEAARGAENAGVTRRPDWYETPSGKAFVDAWEKRFGVRLEGKFWQSKNGLAREYIVFAELHSRLAPQGGQVCFGGHLHPQEWGQGRDQNRDRRGQNPPQVDVVAWHRGELLLVEVKPTLSEALNRHREDGVIPGLSQRAGGRYAKGMVVARDVGNLKEDGPKPSRSDLALLVMQGEALPQGVFRFPDDLPKVFGEWGWL